MQTVGLTSERTRSAVTPPVRASHSHDRCANCRFGKRRSAVTPPVRASHSHDRCAKCRLGKRTYAFGCHTADSSAAQRTSVVQTFGLAIERTRSTVTPPVRTSHSADRCVNLWFGKRTYARSSITPLVRASHSHDRCANCRFRKRMYAFGFQTTGAQLVWQANVRVRRLNRRFTKRTDNRAVSVTSLMTLGPHFDLTLRITFCSPAGITSWLAANCATSICAAGATSLRRTFLVDLSSNHVRVTLLSRDGLYRDIRHWILSLLL